MIMRHRARLRAARAMAADAPFFSRRGARPCASPARSAWGEKKWGWSEQRDGAHEAHHGATTRGGSPKTSHASRPENL
jgi:hypothetical protein